MKFGRLIEYIKRNIFLQKSCEKCDRETGSRSLFVFKKALCEVKLRDLQVRYNKLR